MLSFAYQLGGLEPLLEDHGVHLPVRAAVATRLD